MDEDRQSVAWELEGRDLNTLDAFGVGMPWQPENVCEGDAHGLASFLPVFTSLWDARPSRCG